MDPESVRFAYHPEPSSLIRSPSPMTTSPPFALPARDLLLWMYERMGLIREFEERLKSLVERGVPVGPVHFYTGQEAVAVGGCAALRQTDWIASTHRGHGPCIR